VYTVHVRNYTTATLSRLHCIRPYAKLAELRYPQVVDTFISPRFGFA